jgi:hypothetical protein
MIFSSYFFVQIKVTPFKLKSMIKKIIHIRIKLEYFIKYPKEKIPNEKFIFKEINKAN